MVRAFLALLIASTALAVQAQRTTPKGIEVDKLLDDMNRLSTRNRAVAQLKQLNESAVPRLLQLIAGKHRDKRILAVTALQFCWSPKAVAPTQALLFDRDKGIRMIAWNALLIQQKPDILARDLGPSIHKLKDPEAVGFILPRLERLGPDVNRMCRVMENERFWPKAMGALQRYYSPKLLKVTRKAAMSGKGKIRAAAMTALIHQNDDSPQARRFMVKRLNHPDPIVRDRAAEYLRWHGTLAEQAALTQRAKQEADVYARASMHAAVRAIHLRTQQFKKGERYKPTSLNAASTTLARSPTVATRVAALELLRNAMPFEPFYAYGVEKGSQPDLENAKSRIRLERLAAGYETKKQGKDNTTLKPTPHLVAPVRDFFDPKSKSYGFFIDDDGAFSGSHHIGYDAVWKRQHASVVAVGDGVVRVASAAVESWGGLVVTEHIAPDGRPFCALYAHLGPLVCVKPGDTVRVGEKIGTVGRSFTWENGGYLAHLHFGIHSGTYGAGEWTTGYVSPASFKAGKHGWLNPQSFITGGLKKKP